MAAGQQRAASLLLLSGSDSTATNSRVSVAVLAAAVGAANGWKNAAVVVVNILAAMDDNQLQGYVAVCEDSCHYKAGVREGLYSGCHGGYPKVGSLVDPNMRAGTVSVGRIAEVRDAGVGWVGSNKLLGIVAGDAASGLVRRCSRAGGRWPGMAVVRRCTAWPRRVDQVRAGAESALLLPCAHAQPIGSRVGRAKRGYIPTLLLLNSVASLQMLAISPAMNGD
ncbi:hypothetical protein SASPL_103103 [Salvia splendens]|uniref:Uncharacterized protein n=1 Tax=Salvia splendens TaxID=180675 RepID=A0A8X8YXB1_SALSN|nr:hypothetical protein SASPL_103103 [Salvia splendens]